MCFLHKIIRFIRDYLFGPQETDESLELEFRRAMLILNASDTEDEDSRSEDDEINLCTSLHRTGKITVLETEFGLIDNQYHFDLRVATVGGLKIGQDVSFILYKTCENGPLKVGNVSGINEEEWGDCTAENKLKTTVKKCDILTRSVVGNIIARSGREITVMPQNLKCNLNVIESEFIPMVGDWVVLEALVEVDENVTDLTGEILNVKKMFPLRAKTHSGIVREWDKTNNQGVIDKDIYVCKDNCDSGYLPRVGDKIIADVMESDQGRLSWRALKVIPHVDNNQFSFETENPNNVDDLLDNKHGIIISDCLKFEDLRLGQKSQLKVEVTNNSTSLQTLLRCRFHSKRATSQLTLISHYLDDTFQIKPKETITFRFGCEASFMGTTKELFVFNFKGFKIGRWFEINVISDPVDGETFKRQKNLNLARKLVMDKDADVFQGSRLIKPPAFIPIKMGIYNVPKRLFCAVLGRTDTDSRKIEEIEIAVEHVMPCLKRHSVTFELYNDYFHTLLYLEEIQMMINMRVYDIDRGHFVVNGEYLMLEVPNLRERRPSLMIGDRVVASEIWNEKGPKFEGYIHKIQAKNILLKFNCDFHNRYRGEEYHITFLFMRTTLRRCHQAVDVTVKNLGKGFLFPNGVKQKRPQTKFSVNDDITWKNLKNQKLHETKNEMKNANNNLDFFNHDNATDNSKISKNNNRTMKSHISGRTRNDQKQLIWLNEELNFHQKEAIKNILYGLARPLPYIIFGPPGTGKTVTVVEAVMQVFRMVPGCRLLVASPSNSSADLLAIRLLDSGVLRPGDLVRLVAHRCVLEGSVPERLIPFCATGELAREGTRQAQDQLLLGARLGCSTTTLGRHRITVATCVSLGQLFNMGFARGHFTHLFIDEAGQATEPETLIPLSFLDVNSGQVILAGDPMQLGPVVMSRLASRYGMNESLLVRLINRFPYLRDSKGFPETGGYDPRLITRLVTNYRSVPEILNLPSTLFYESELKATVSQTEGPKAELLRLLADTLPRRDEGGPPAVVFHGVRGDNLQHDDCPSWFNPQEAMQIFYYVTRFYSLGIKAEEIGIITPYAKQVQQIRNLMNVKELDMPKIGSVEEFQGQERDIIVLSTVRSSSSQIVADIKHTLGFIASPQRLNVALTRARVLTLIIGNPHVLVQDVYWRSALMYCIKNNAYTGCDLPQHCVSQIFDD